MAPRTTQTSQAAAAGADAPEAASGAGGGAGAGAGAPAPAPPALTGVAANMMTMFENLGANHTLAEHMVHDHGVDTPAELGVLGDEGWCCS